MKVAIPGKGLILPLSLVLALQACRREQPQEAEQPVTITSFSPEQGAEGATVVLTGRHFDPDAAKNQVKFKDIEAPVVSVGANNTELTVTVPENAVTGKISVTVGQHTATTGKDFVVNPGAPLITAVAPEKGDIGTEVTITGNNFKDGLKVFFGNVEATGAVVSKKTIKVKVPATAITAKVRIMQHDVEAMSPGNFYLRPVISSFGTGLEEDTLIIEGTNFSDILADNSVRFGNIQADLVAATATQLQVKIPAGLTDSQRVYVKVKEMEGESQNKFFYLRPVITSIVPLQAEEGAIITIKGQHFSHKKEKNRVKFGNGQALPEDIISVSSTEIKVKVPATAEEGTIRVLVGSQETFHTAYFTLFATVTDFSPKRAEVDATVTITGKHLSSIWEIKLNGAACPIVSRNEKEIKITVPGRNSAIVGGKFTFKDNSADRETNEEFTVTGIWRKRSGAAPYFATSQTQNGTNFVLDGKIYVGQGYNYNGRFKVYDINTLQWTEGNSVSPMQSRSHPIALVVNNKLYTGLGTSGGSVNDWWQFDKTTDSWTQLEKLPVSPVSTVGMAYQGKAYVGGGNSDGFYEFTPNGTGGNWKKVGTQPGSTYYQSSFTLNGQLYYGGGYDNGRYPTSFYRFDPVTYSITQMADLPVTTMYFGGDLAPAFSMADKGYVLCKFLQLYQYDPVGNTWINKGTAFDNIRQVQVVDNRVWGWTIDGTMYEYIVP